MASISRAVRRVSEKAAGEKSRVTAILGSQWGDEGKGKLADVLAKKFVSAGFCKSDGVCVCVCVCVCFLALLYSLFDRNHCPK